ncbi:MAG: hydantoinase/oxoprolinase family protein [Anaerolineae bacterium]
MHVGVDIGGTFTDLVLNAGGQLTIHKLPSTPHNPALAMLAGLQAITGHQVAQLERVAHGSTVATNAILERKGAKTALITTQGFRDVLFIGRQNRPVLYALQPTLPPPLIPRPWCCEVPERLDFQGNVLIPLDYDALDRVLDDLVAQGVESVAVCFLYSYINPMHEQAVRERILARGLLEAWQVALSCEVLPEFREYERASTVALEAYVRPIMSRYIGQLEQELAQHNSHTGLRIMKSDGGVISAGRIKQQAIQTALSGPAAGVIGAVHLAQLAGYTNIITLDMGGTSTDVALCPGAPVHRPQSEIDGLPLRVRLLDIETIGAGGGSIARVDAGGLLQVGPESAGADPGPVVYGRGGQQITVSDANALLGRLDAEHFLGGGMRLDIPAAERIMQGLAAQLGLSPQAAAQGVLDIANTNIDRAVRRVSVARGYDPREFTLVAFGGAGGLHACAVAERLQMPRVLIPQYPGVLCAFGLLVADVVLEYSQSLLTVVNDATAAEIQARLAAMTAQADIDLAREGIAEADKVYLASLDVRYQGQAYELNMAYAVSTAESLVEAFHQAHQNTYGHALPRRTVEVVNLRLQAVGQVARPPLAPRPLQDEPSAESALVGHKATPNGETLALYDRERLLPGMRFEGGALVFQLDSTTYVPSGWRAAVDVYGQLALEKI